MLEGGSHTCPPEGCTLHCQVGERLVLAESKQEELLGRDGPCALEFWDRPLPRREDFLEGGSACRSAGVLPPLWLSVEAWTSLPGSRPGPGPFTLRGLGRTV